MISIITPTYNRAHLLSRMLDSVVRQSYSNWELLIMDDGSTDNTIDIVEDYQDPRIKLIRGKNTGPAQKRNEGVMLARGEYIIFLDSDDEVKSHWLELLIEDLSQDNEQIASCSFIKVDNKGEKVEEVKPKMLGPMFDNYQLNFLAGTLLLKRKYFLEAGGYDVDLSSGQHTELLFRLLPVFEKFNVTIKLINVVLVIIHIHHGERIRTNYDGIFRGSTRTLKKHQQRFLRNAGFHFNYTSIAAVMAMRTNRLPEARKYLWIAIKIRPFDLKSYVRFMITFFPSITKRVYPGNGEG